jgi:hypothetical protein
MLKQLVEVPKEFLVKVVTNFKIIFVIEGVTDLFSLMVTKEFEER